MLLSKWLHHSHVSNKYRVILNSLTHFIKLVHLNGGKDCNMRLTYGKNLQVLAACLISALCVCLLWHGRRKAENQFPPIPSEACHDRILRWQRWFVFAAQADPVVEAIEKVLNLPRKKITRGVRSGDHGGQRSGAWSFAVVRLIQRWGKCWLTEPQPPTKLSARGT
jgi:hypothetical protein